MEKRPNRTRSGFILLAVSLILLILILACSLLAFSISLYRAVNSKPRRDRIEHEIQSSGFSIDFFDFGYDRSVEKVNEPLRMNCVFNIFGMVIVAIFTIISAAILFSGRNSFGKEHRKRILAALIIACAAPVIVGIIFFTFLIFEVVYIGIIGAVFIILALIDVFLVTSSLGNKPCSKIALLIGITFTFPMCTITESYIEASNIPDLRYFTAVGVSILVGLLTSSSLYLASVKKAIRSTNENTIGKMKS